MLQFALALSCLTFIHTVLGQNQSLPQVDLGYEIHQALYLNTSAQTYHFNNIRYAQPPVGNLRFAAPLSPTGRNTTVQNGSQGPIVCPQAIPAWSLIAADLLKDYAAGNLSAFNYTQEVNALPAEIAAQPNTTTPGITEDCLFLDVVVPKAVMDNAHNMRKRQSGGVPVLVLIYGGGFTFGSKDASSSVAEGLIKSSQSNGGQGIIFVSFNYRLGAFGWLAGPTLQASGGVSNAGLYDQRLALAWVNKYISLFGGNPSQVTVIGESAGGSSIEHQLTAYGGQRNISFQRAILQSPGFAPIYGQGPEENTTQTFLGLLNVTSIAAARNLSSAALIQANTYQIGTASYGTFVYGPVVDGIFVPQLPGLGFLNGQYYKNVQVMTGFNANEGITFGPPNLNNETAFQNFLSTRLPGIADYNVNYILNVLYPPVYNGSYGYTSPLTRSFALIADFAFVCNTYYVQKAYNFSGYAYEFAVFPGYHGEDVPYTLYDGQGSSLSASSFLYAPVAVGLQGYITNFALTGNPNGANLTNFPAQGMNASMNVLNLTGITTVKDPANGPRCMWWQEALYT